MIYAMIDIGSNTIRLCFYKAEGASFRRLFSEKVTASLAGFVEDGNLSPKGIQRAVEALQSFLPVLECVPSEVHAFATASLRNIGNREAVVAEILQKTGLSVDVISGEEEGELDFLGVTHGENLQKGLLIDVGGGSTELVPFAGKVRSDGVSLPIGSLNLYRRHVLDLLPTEREYRALEQTVQAHLDKLSFPEQSYKTLCGVGGSARAALRLVQEELGMGFGKTMKMDYMKKVLWSYVTSRAMARERILQVVPERVHTVLPGMVVLQTVAEHFGCKELFVSNSGAREGYLLKKVLHKHTK